MPATERSRTGQTKKLKQDRVAMGASANPKMRYGTWTTLRSHPELRQGGLISAMTSQWIHEATGEGA